MCLDDRGQQSDLSPLAPVPLAPRTARDPRGESRGGDRDLSERPPSAESVSAALATWLRVLERECGNPALARHRIVFRLHSSPFVGSAPAHEPPAREQRVGLLPEDGAGDEQQLLEELEAIADEPSGAQDTTKSTSPASSPALEHAASKQ